MADQYGFGSPEPVHLPDTDVAQDEPGATVSAAQRRREEANVSWWLSQLTMATKRFMMRPSDDRKAVLDALLADYRKHVEAGTVRKPRFNID